MGEQMFKFKPLIKHARKQLNCNINFKVKQKGKEFNLYDSIQEARQDTELYSVLERYGCIPKHCIDYGKVYEDFRGLGDLKDIKMQQIKANEMWEALPFDVRKEFNNDKYLFAKDGEKYIQKKLDAMKPKEPAMPTTPAETVTTPTTGGTNVA